MTRMFEAIDDTSGSNLGRGRESCKSSIYVLLSAPCGRYFQEIYRLTIRLVSLPNGFGHFPATHGDVLMINGGVW